MSEDDEFYFLLAYLHENPDSFYLLAREGRRVGSVPP